MFGAELRKARAAAGLSQEKLAFRAGISRNHVSDLERGVAEPSLGVFLDLCNALGVDAGIFASRLQRSRKRRRRA